MIDKVIEPADIAYWQRARFLASVGWMILLLGWEGVSPFIPEFEWHTERLRHAVKNWALAIINALLVASCFSAMWVAACEVGAEHNWGFIRRVSLPAPVAGVIAVLLLDLWTYWWHRLNHVIPFLWRFHRTHHSDPKMDATTANRFHFGEIALSSVLRVPILFLVGVDFWQLAAYETALQSVVLLHHANVALPSGLESFLSKIIVTPMIHKVHHSQIANETDSNYSSLFSVWDRLFRSFHSRPDPEAIQFGLTGFDSRRHQSLKGMLMTPLTAPHSTPSRTPSNH